MEEKDLLEMPIEVINPGNGLPEAPTCAPCGAGIPCYDDYANFGCGVVIYLRPSVHSNTETAATSIWAAAVFLILVGGESSEKQALFPSFGILCPTDAHGVSDRPGTEP